MKTTLAILLLLGVCGCAQMSYSELEHKSITCDPESEPECKGWVERFERLYEKRQQKEQEKCPKGQIILRDRFKRAQCMSRYDYKIFTSPWGI